MFITIRHQHTVFRTRTIMIKFQLFGLILSTSAELKLSEIDAKIKYLYYFTFFRLSSNQTPGTRDNNSRASNHPVTNNVSKQKVPNSPKLPPSRTPVSNHSPKPPHIKTPVSNVSPRAPQREPRAHQDARVHPEARAPPTSQSARSVQSVRSVPPSPAKPTPPIVTVNNGSGSRDSPVVVSSGSSSPVSIVSVHSNSRPNSPSAAGSISIIKSREVSPQPHPQRSRTSSPANTLLNTG